MSNSSKNICLRFQAGEVNRERQKDPQLKKNCSVFLTVMKGHLLLRNLKKFERSHCMLNRQTTLPNNMASIEGGNTPYPSDVKLLGINQLNLPNLNEAVQKLNGSSSVEYELFISNASATQYGYLKLKGGKVVKFILLLELHVIFVRPVKTMDTKTIG